MLHITFVYLVSLAVIWDHYYNLIAIPRTHPFIPGNVSWSYRHLSMKTRAVLYHFTSNTIMYYNHPTMYIYTYTPQTSKRLRALLSRQQFSCHTMVVPVFTTTKNHVIRSSDPVTIRSLGHLPDLAIICRELSSGQ